MDQRLLDAENDQQRRQRLKECGQEAWRKAQQAAQQEEAAAAKEAAAAAALVAGPPPPGPRLDPVGAAAAHPMASAAAAALAGSRDSSRRDATSSSGAAAGTGNGTGTRRDNRPAWMVESEQAAKRSKNVDERSSATVITAAPVLSLAGVSKAKKAAGSAPLKTAAAFGEEAAAARPLVRLHDESEAARDQRIAESLPRDRDELFAWPIAWAALEAKPDALDSKIRK
jgi:hypothetical protein